MATKKPQNIKEYKQLFKKKFKFDFNSEPCKNLFETNVQGIALQIKEHVYFRDLDNKIKSWSIEYYKNTKSDLLMINNPLELLKKTFDSAIDKSFRINVLWNKEYPKPPDKGWVTPQNLFIYFNDIIRGLLVCRFIDGPIFLAEKLTKYAKALKLESHYYTQERDEGYYAYHFYVRLPVNILSEFFISETNSIEVEIQITTQLQEVLKNLTHQFYQINRIKYIEPSNKWKWDFKSNQFKISYLSHTLHLIESVIVEARERALAEKKKENKSG